MGYIHWGHEEGRSGRRVVLKTPKEGKDRDEEKLYRDKLADETNILSAVNHPNIVEYVDKRSAGNFVLVEEDVEGPVFYSAFKGKPASENEARICAERILDALQSVHSRNVIYRDLKPANIIHHPSRRAVLIDFGAAKLGFLHQVDPSHPGTVVFSPGWTAPEQEIRPGEVTEASDIYALGTTLFFILTGKEPRQFMRSDGSLFKAPRDENPSVSRELSEVISRVVQSDQRLRPQTAEDMRKLLKGTWRQFGVPNIIVGGRRCEIRDVLEIGRRHDCRSKGCSTKHPLDIPIDDPGMYVASHQARITLDKSGKCWLEDVNALNRLAVSKRGQGWNMIRKGERRGLEDKDMVALVYAPGKGPYMTMTFNAS